MESKIKPLRDRVVVKRVQEETKTPGGIYIPDNAKEKPVDAVVVAVGSGKLCDDGSIKPLEVQVGDRVVIGKYAGNEIKVDGVNVSIVREEDILAVIGGA